MPKKIAANHLEHLQVLNAKPGPKEVYLNDGGGLWVVIHADGAKRWQYQFSLHGKRGKMWLGYFPAVGLAEARSLRDEAQSVVKQGQDPRIARKIEKATQATKVASTFETVAREWHTRQLNRWGAPHALKIIESLEADGRLHTWRDSSRYCCNRHGWAARADSERHQGAHAAESGDPDWPPDPAG